MFFSGDPSNTLHKEMHYSWECAKLIHYSHDAQQVGPI